MAMISPRSIQTVLLLMGMTFSAGAAPGQRPASPPAAAPTAPAAVSGIVTPQPTVPEAFTLEGEFVRIAYNSEGFVTLGYRLANASKGEDWMLLEAGITLRRPTKGQDLNRGAISIRTPDGRVIPLATQKAYMDAYGLRPLNMRFRVMNDPLNYFPVDASRACALGFFADTSGPGPGLAFDVLGLEWQRACIGRLFFKVPGGIQIGQHYLIVKFAASEIQVPFQILTKEQEREFRNRWEEIKNAHESALPRE